MAVVGGVVVTSDSQEYGITQSALSLLRSLEMDHPDGDSELAAPLPGPLLCHDCGFPIGLGCTNFGTDWDVRHAQGDVVLSNPTLIDATGSPSQRRWDLYVRLPIAKYRDSVINFAREARRFYFADGTGHGSELPDMDKVFWAEFDIRLKRAEVGRVKPGVTAE